MRNIGGGIQRNLTGSLLVAHPSLHDPNFRRTVLFISVHDPNDGALGVILNRPLDKHVGDLVTDEAPPALSEVPVYIGGPVGRNQLMFAILEWEQNSLKLNHNVGLEEANELLGHDPESIRAFVGYAGWSAGQLEEEMKQKAWLVHKPTPSALKADGLPKLWFDIMRSLGPWYKLLAAAPDDPSLN
jgi:putative transcriptional regulator